MYFNLKEVFWNKFYHLLAKPLISDYQVRTYKNLFQGGPDPYGYVPANYYRVDK
jgi:hypothetical protein